MNKKFVLTLVFAVFAVVPCALAQQRVRQAAVVEVGKVTYQQEEITRRYTGRLVSPSTVLMVPRVSGEIQKVGFKDGAMVKKGEILYQLDPVQYFAALKACEARVEQCKAEVVQCQAKEKYAQNNYERNQALFKKSVVSQDTLDSAVSAYDVAKAASAAAKANLHAAEANLVKAQDDYRNTQIVAPMNAQAGVTTKTAGNYITPAVGSLVTLIQTNPMRVRFSLSYGDYLNLLDNKGKITTMPTIRLRLANGSFYQEKGELELINNETNRNTDAIQLYARFKNNNNILYHGGTVAVYLTFTQKNKKLAVIPSAIMHDSSGSYVYVVENVASKTEPGKMETIAVRRDLKLGVLSTDWQFVEKGLKENELIIVDGMNKTMAGGLVVPNTPAPATR